MQNVAAVWTGLAARQRIIVAAAAFAVFAAVLLISRLAMQPNLALLYAGLEGPAAADVITALEQRGVPHQVRGDAIYAPQSERDALRIALAGEGLPQTGAAGYELLDSLSGFGTTAQMFDAAYWRAKEGELARTISASPQIRTARVHIANPDSQPFRRDAQPSASIFVTPAGAGIEPGQAQALKFLVAAAVSRLEPSAVSVIDASSGTVIDGEAQSSIGEMEAERAGELQRSVERLLEARVGPGRAVVEVRIEPVTDREQIMERRFDPEERVAISTETEERNSTAEGPAGGAVTVASDLPDGDANQEAGQQSSQDTETRELTNFEVSETQREILREPGGIRRLTVAVLVDGTRETQPDGTEVWEPRSEAELEDMRALVASAVGFDAERGDEITIRSLAFMGAPEGEAGTGPAAPFAIDTMQLIQLGVLALVSLILGLFVLRPILAKPAAETPTLPPPSEEGVGSVDPGGGVAGSPPGAPLNTVSDFAFQLDAGDPALPSFDPEAPGDSPVLRLRQMIDERQDETMEILQSWMTNDKERAR